MNRFNGTEDFNRDYIEYEQGFGDLDVDFWLGRYKLVLSLHYLILRQL